MQARSSYDDFKSWHAGTKKQIERIHAPGQGGETIIVTERGKTIGQIIPVKPTIEEKLQAVVDSGLADWNGKKVKPGKPVAINHGKKQVADLVAEDRDVNYLP